MNSKSWLGMMSLAVPLLLLLLLLVGDGQVEALPGRKDRRKNTDTSSWFDNNNSNKNKNILNNNNQGWGSNTGAKKKGGAMKTLKKAAVIGAVAYGGYQIGKLSGRFGSYGYGRGGAWGFNDWNKWREIDGFMCRDDNDCNWIDARLYCQDYELDFQPSSLWFGGDIARIVGECACPRGMVWNNNEMECESNLYWGLTTTLLTVVIVLAVLFTFCCCICGFLIFRRFF